MMVAFDKWQVSRRNLMIWKVVELSNPVLISSMNIVCLGPTIISPARGQLSSWPHFHSKDFEEAPPEESHSSIEEDF